MISENMFNKQSENSTSKMGTNFDKYYTREEVVDKCLGHINLKEYDLVIEPSAGDGSFYKVINHKNKIGMDIKPESNDIELQDWLTYNVDDKYTDVLIVGNPPFGKSHKLSTEFIQHSFSFNNVKTIGFILPDVYKKYTRQKIIPSNWRIKNIIDIGKDCFTFNGVISHIPCSFFILDRSYGRDMRDISHTYKDKVDFTFGDKNDFDFFVFGAAPKRIIHNPKSNNRGHYIKSKIDKGVLKNKFMTIEWKGLSSASGGVYWLSQGEILKHYYETHCK